MVLQDGELDVISTQLGTVKEIAIAMGTELATQENMLNEVEKKIDRAAEKMDHINVSMKRTMEKVYPLHFFSFLTFYFPL